MRKISPLIILAILFLVFEALVRSEVIRSFILPAPSDVLRSLVNDRIELFGGALQTATYAAAGLILSFIVGTSLAILLNFSKWLKDAVFPIAIFFQTVPIVAIAPLLVIWFGYGPPTVIASAFIVSIFAIIASVLLGLESTDVMLVDLFRIYSADRLQILFTLRLPSALPQIFSGLRIGAGLAVIGAIVGEFVSGTGLGSVVDSARTQQRIDKVFAAVVISAFIGLIFVSFINYISWLTLRSWHSSEYAR